MKKDTKRAEVLAARAKTESLLFQTMWGAKQKLNEVTPEMESRINEELLVLNNLKVAADILALKNAIDEFKNKTGITVEPSRGIIAGSLVAYCLGLEPVNPLESGANLNPLDFKLPLWMTVTFDNDVRNMFVDNLKEKGHQMTTYLGQPVLKLGNVRVEIRRVVKA